MTESSPNFKGIFFRFLSDFAVLAHRLFPQEVQTIRDYILRNADFLWRQGRNSENGLPASFVD